MHAAHTGRPAPVRRLVTRSGPWTEHALTSMESAPTIDKIHSLRETCLCDQKTILHIVAGVWRGKMTPEYRTNVDYGRRAVRSPAAMSKMLANCEEVYIPAFLAHANVAEASYFKGGIQCSPQSNGTPDIALANG